MAVLKKFKMHINGEWVDSLSGEFFKSYNPFTGKPWALLPQGNAEDAESAMNAAHKSFSSGEWSSMTASQRGRLLHKIGEKIAEKSEYLAEVEVTENGKLISEMSAQLNYVPEWFSYYGGLADKIEGHVIPSDKPGYFNYTQYEPLGVVVAISPWNSPIMLTVWKLAPALAAGNTVVIKPSEHASAGLLELMKILEEAGIPKGVVNVVTGFGNEIGQALVKHPKAAKIAFTGGEDGGRAVYRDSAENLSPVTLELGGKSPNIVFGDVDIDKATNGVIAGIFAATGQTCIAGSRLLLHKSIEVAFLKILSNKAKMAKIGNPANRDTQVGPITTKAQMEKVLNYIKIAKEEGAECIVGGQRYDNPDFRNGWFVEPTIFKGVKNDMRIAQEEVFGPVLSVITFQTDEEALEIANDVEYGLAAGVWTNDMPRAFHFVNKLKAGTVWVNTYRAISYMSPFGGYKKSGIGRENGQEAIKEYLQVKSIWFNTSEKAINPFIIQ